MRFPRLKIHLRPQNFVTWLQILSLTKQTQKRTKETSLLLKKTDKVKIYVESFKTNTLIKHTKIMAFIKIIH